jgi:protein-S-isoprenylcysteine O-methyltransferase Ste14
MKRALIVSYSVIAYAGFLAVILWAIAFLADVHAVTAVDRGPRDPRLEELVIDLALLGAFALHHSVMARDSAKRLLTRVLPAEAERSTYVLAADALLALVLWQWRPIAGSVWHVSAQPWRDALWVGYGLGWLTAVASTLMVDHFDLVGLRQAASRPGEYEPPTFKVRWLYAWVRHPLMLGLLIAFWITAGHLLFALAATGYIAIGLQLEERGLRRELGQPYLDYASQVPAIVPRLDRRRPDAPRTRRGPAETPPARR